MLRAFWILLPALVPLSVASAASDGVNYEEHIKPIFRQHCLTCHGEDKQEADLNLQTYATALKGGSGGVAVAAGRSSQSLLFKRITDPDDDARMPPNKPAIPPEQIAMIQKWIDSGLREASGSKSLVAERDISFIEVPLSRLSNEDQKYVQKIKNPSAADQPSTANKRKPNESPLDLVSAVKREAQQSPGVPSFRQDVMPVLFRAGCNAGACHGAAKGKDGFMLSLFGYDPAGDYHRIVNDIAGRRINLAIPERSLLLLKSLGKVPHTGGERFTTDSAYYRTLLDWIAAGAPDDAQNVPDTIGLEVSAESFVFAGETTKSELRVLAQQSDGSKRDVTHLALYHSSNPAVATIDESGRISAAGAGDTHVFARYSRFAIGASVTVLKPGNFQWPNPVAHNYIDTHTFDRLQKLRIAPSELCDAEPREKRIFWDNAAAPARHLVDGRPMPPKTLGATEPLKSDGDPRQALAGWLTSPDNDLFSRNLANRIWAQLMGRGIVHPVDDVRVTNPPVNEPLLADLAAHLVASKFNLRSLVRDICSSRTYQLSSMPNDTNRRDTRHFSHAYLRRLRADVFIDCVVAVTGMPRKFSGFAEGTHAIDYYPRVPNDTGQPTYGDDVFKCLGRSPRGSVSSTETKTAPTLSQALHLSVGDTIQPRLSCGGTLQSHVKAQTRPATVVKELFIRCLNRQPTAEELRDFQKLIPAPPASPEPYEDIVWALLNSTEFMFNH